MMIDSAFNHTIDYTASNAKQEFIMSTISANDLKTKGVQPPFPRPPVWPPAPLTASTPKANS